MLTIYNQNSYTKLSETVHQDHTEMKAAFKNLYFNGINTIKIT